MDRSCTRATALALLAAGVSACAAARPAQPAPASPAPSAAAAAPAVADRHLPLGIGGTLELRVPASWEVSEGERDGAVPPTFRLGPAGGAFVLLVTPLWDPRAQGGAADPGLARALADEARGQALAQAVEPELPLRELEGDGVVGFFFASTDRALAGKAPSPGEYRHLLQGVAAVGRVLVAFSLLDDGDGPHRAAALEAIRTARDAPPPASEAFEPDPDVGTLPLSVQAPGRSWAVLVDLPGFEAMAPRRVEGGKALLALARNDDTGVVASVVLRPADGARDARACRDRDLARLRSRLALEGLVVSESGGAARARYGVAELDGQEVRQANAHVWLARDGTCVAVHASLMDADEEGAAALERLLASVRFAESL